MLGKLFGVLWYVKGCVLLWRCCYGKGTHDEITAIRETRKRYPLTSVESAAALNKVLCGARSALNYIKERDGEFARVKMQKQHPQGCGCKTGE